MCNDNIQVKVSQKTLFSVCIDLCETHKIILISIQVNLEIFKPLQTKILR